ncbi:MAG: glycerate kinase, partial [Gemmatimonadales bacterium]
ITAEGRFDRTSLAGKAPGEVVRRAQRARKPVAIVAAQAANLVGVPVASGDGTRLDVAGVAALAERVVREALGLPAP